MNADKNIEIMTSVCSSSSDSEYEHDTACLQSRKLNVLLQIFIRDNVNTPRKVETVVRCAINYCKGISCVPLWNWRNEFEIMKREEFANLYSKYIKSNDDKWCDYNIKKLYQIALKYDNENEDCKKLYYEEFPQENKQLKKQMKEEEDEENQRKYESMKEDFEETHFKCADQFYQIYENKLRPYSKQGFCTKYEDFRINDDTSFLDKWLKDSTKRQYQKIDFVPPPNKCTDNTFNTWDLVEKFNDEINDTVNTQIFYDFFKCLCGKEEEVYDYLIKYLAHLLKYPAIKPHTALFFTGSQGGGKDTLSLIIKKLIGKETVMVDTNPDNVFGNFNWRRMNKLVVCLQETDNIKSYSNKIKDLITCETATLADKCVKGIDVNDFTRLFIFSNDENIIKIEPSDRRFVVIKTWDFYHNPNEQMFNELYDAINNTDMINKLRHELQSYNIDKDFKFEKNRPITEIYQDLKEVNTPSIIQWAWDLTSFKDECSISSTELCTHYNAWCKDRYDNSKDTTTKSFGLNLKKYFCINKVWVGFEWKRFNAGIKYKINTETLKSLIEDKYGYIGEI